MTVKLQSLTLNSSRPEEMVKFYSVLGFQFHLVKAAGESKLYRSENHDIELSIFGMREKNAPQIPVFQMTLSVENIQSVHSDLAKLGAMTILEPTKLQQGTHAIVTDPEGNSLELVATE